MTLTLYVGRRHAAVGRWTANTYGAIYSNCCGAARRWQRHAGGRILPLLRLHSAQRRSPKVILVRSTDIVFCQAPPFTLPRWLFVHQQAVCYAQNQDRFQSRVKRVLLTCWHHSHSCWCVTPPCIVLTGAATMRSNLRTSLLRLLPTGNHGGCYTRDPRSPGQAEGRPGCAAPQRHCPRCRPAPSAMLIMACSCLHWESSSQRWFTAHYARQIQHRV